MKVTISYKRYGSIERDMTLEEFKEWKNDHSLIDDYLCGLSEKELNDNLDADSDAIVPTEVNSNEEPFEGILVNPL